MRLGRARFATRSQLQKIFGAAQKIAFLESLRVQSLVPTQFSPFNAERKQ